MSAATSIGPAFRAGGLIVVLMVGGLFADPALAQGQTKGDASIRLEYQHIRTGTFEFDLSSFFGEADYWTTDTQVAILSGDYAISDRITVFGALPYVRKRFNSQVDWGGDPHNPNDPYWVDYVPSDKSFWDDGDYHSHWQDFSIGMSYVLTDGPRLTVSPFISYGFPASDYPFFAKAAIGKNLWTVPVGVNLAYVPYFSDWHFEGSFGYVFSEQPLDENVDYSVLHLSAGYWFKPNLSVNVFVAGKYTWEGLEFADFQDDPLTAAYPDEYDTEEWYNHDRLYAASHLNVGAGFDYFLDENYKVSGSGYTSTWAESTNEIDFAFTLAVTRFFSGSE